MLVGCAMKFKVWNTKNKEWFVGDFSEVVEVNWYITGQDVGIAMLEVIDFMGDFEIVYPGDTGHFDKPTT